MSLIGISGKIGSGKDTIGNIIQYLILESKIKSGLPFTNQKLDNSGWKIKKFADKLKDIVCLLIGSTKEQLEDREFKEKELGEEWWFNHIVPEHGLGTKLINWDKDLKPQKMTPRKLLQLLGTECGRNIIHPNIWVNSLFADYKADINTYHHAYSKDGENYGLQTLKYPNWIITDMRFPNELEAIKKRGGITIRVNRVTFKEQETEFGKVSTIIQPEVDNLLENNHPSETSLDSATFDYVIDNNSDIQSLIKKVKIILEKENIL